MTKANASIQRVLESSISYFPDLKFSAQIFRSEIRDKWPEVVILTHKQPTFTSTIHVGYKQFSIPNGKELFSKPKSFIQFSYETDLAGGYKINWTSQIPDMLALDLTTSSLVSTIGMYKNCTGIVSVMMRTELEGSKSHRLDKGLELISSRRGNLEALYKILMTSVRDNLPEAPRVH